MEIFIGIDGLPVDLPQFTNLCGNKVWVMMQLFYLMVLSHEQIVSHINGIVIIQEINAAEEEY